MSHGTFATTINCMDGRTQLPINDFIKSNYHVDFVDTITEAGPDKILADNTDATTIESIKKRVLVSTEKHGSKKIIIVAHYDCAGNPVDKETHLKHLQEARNTINSWGLPTDIQILTVWVDENWQVNLI